MKWLIVKKQKETIMIKRNIKMRVTADESKLVQEICFADGVFWITSEDILQDYEFIFIKDNYLYRFTTSSLFKESSLEEVDASFFIKTQGTCVEETLEEELKQNINKEETMEKNEVKSYADVKEYLIAKGLYERVLEIDWDYGGEPTEFSELFIWDNVEEGLDFWNDWDDALIRLKIEENIESLVQDYKAKQGKEFIEHLEAQPEEAVEAKPIQKPKQYLCYVQGKALPKHIHKTLEQAKQEAQRLCRKELAKVSVLEVVAEYEAEVLVKERV